MDGKWLWLDRPLNHSRRRLIAALAAVPGLAVLGLAGCDDSQPAEKARPSAPARPRIALVMKTLTNPFFVGLERGARKAEAELGIELLVKTAAQETSIEQQIVIIDELIRDKVAAIIIAPGDSVRLIQVLKKARDAGIAVVNIDNRLDGDFSAKIGLAGVPFISVDNRQGAQLVVQAISGDITRPTEAAVIEGIRGAANAEARHDGARLGFAQNPLITLVAEETANWKIDEGYEVARTIFSRHPAVRLLFCANDMMALGAARYVQEAQLAGVRIAGFDALAEARQAVAAGTMAATADQQADQQGYLGVVYAVRLLHGDSVPPETLLDVRLVTAATP